MYAVTRVVSGGEVVISVSVVTKDMAACGYADGSERDQAGGGSKVVRL